MPTFVLMTKLAPEALQDARGRRAMGKEWIERVHTVCPDVTFRAHYALLGPYDFMDIYEAPDQETASRVAMISLLNGAFSAETWNAVLYKRFVELTETI